METGKKIDVDQIDLDELKDKTTENPGLVSFPHHVGAAMVKPEDKGKIKGRALMAMKEQTDSQLKKLYEQMQVLVKQANQIKQRVEVSESIYHSVISFEPVIGQVYYLYEKNPAENVLSLIAPEEWGKSMPYLDFIAKVKLLADHTWEVLQDHD